MTHIIGTYKGNFDTGSFQYSVKGEVVLNTQLLELNQNSAHFDPELNGNFERAIRRAYELGKQEVKEKALVALNRI